MFCQSHSNHSNNSTKYDCVKCSLSMFHARYTQVNQNIARHNIHSLTSPAQANDQKESSHLDILHPPEQLKLPPLMELSNSRTKVIAFVLERQPDAVASRIAAVAQNAVAPPVHLNLRDLKGEEDDDARDGNGAGERCRSDEIVLERECQHEPRQRQGGGIFLPWTRGRDTSS